MAAWRALRQPPVSFGVQLAVAPFDPVSGQNLLDAFHERPWRRHVIQRQVAIQTRQAQAAIDFGMYQDRLQLRTEEELFSLPRDVQGLDAHTVASQDEAPGRSGPERHREHATQSRECAGVPLEESAKDGLRVAMRLETVAQALQLTAKFQVVVDLAIEDDGRFAVVALNGLITAHQIDDLQAGCAQRADVGTEHPLLVGTAMNERRGGGLNTAGIGRPALMGKTNDATQKAKNPSSVVSCQLSATRRIWLGQWQVIAGSLANWLLAADFLLYHERKPV